LVVLPDQQLPFQRPVDSYFQKKQQVALRRVDCRRTKLVSFTETRFALVRMRFGVFIYDGVEPIDLAAFGVLSMARRVAPQIEPVAIAPRGGAVALSNGLEVTARYGVDDAPRLDVLIVTGGPGWKTQCRNDATLEYVRRVARESLVASVCTGGMILAASGILDGRKATTKKEVIAGQEEPPLQVMQRDYPAIEALPARLVDCGRVVTGGGVTLCIDVVLHLLERLLGAPVAAETARILEYSTAWHANRQTFRAVVA
jgi:transcriptional regulator GlxA family with amidase domain